MSSDAYCPPAEFVISCVERDGFPIVAVINTAFAAYDRCRDFPWLVELEILAAKTDDRGLPTLEEVDQLNAIEERLQQAISPADAHFIARQTWKGRRMLDYYVADGPAVRQRVSTLVLQSALPRNVTVQTSKDDSWTTWMPTLDRMCQPAAETVAGNQEFEQAVLVRIPLSGGEFGSDEEQEDVLTLVDVLSEIAADSGAGAVDGYEFGNAEAALFVYGADADVLFVSIEPALRNAPVARGALVTKRYGRADAAAAREKTFTL